MAHRLLAGCVSVAVAFTLAACASNPVAVTIGSDSHGLAIEEFFTKDPHDLRLALRTDDRAKRGPVDPSIVVRATVGSRPSTCYAFALVPVDASSPTAVVLEQPPANRRWYVFGLSRDGIETFERARREVQPSRSGGGNLNFQFAIDGAIAYADDPQGSPLRIDFAVDRKAGYFTMSAERIVRPAAAATSARLITPCGASE